jgi:hypothetical protein
MLYQRKCSAFVNTLCGYIFDIYRYADNCRPLALLRLPADFSLGEPKRASPGRPNLLGPWLSAHEY